MFKGKGKKLLWIIALGIGALVLLRRKGKGFGETGSFASFFNDAQNIESSARSAIDSANNAISTAGRLNVAVNAHVSTITDNPDILKDYYRGTLPKASLSAARDAAKSNPAAAKAAQQSVATEARATFANIKSFIQSRGFRNN
jgi:hypothetical protein